MKDVSPAESWRGKYQGALVVQADRRDPAWGCTANGTAQNSPDCGSLIAPRHISSHSPKFTLRANRGLELPIHGDGLAVRSYLYVEDVADAYITVLLKGKVGAAAGRGRTQGLGNAEHAISLVLRST